MSKIIFRPVKFGTVKLLEIVHYFKFENDCNSDEIFEESIS